MNPGELIPADAIERPGLSGDLFDHQDPRPPAVERLGPGTVLFRAAAAETVETLLDDLRRIVRAAPFRQMRVPGGRTMSVAMTNCGSLGWVSDLNGYRYAACDPASDRPWPAMPASFSRLAGALAARAGFPGFAPDACLINRYRVGTRLSLHQDRDECNLAAPIVSLSLGLPVLFLLGGLLRGDQARRLLLSHGDVLVWGGPDRLRFHGVLPLKAGCHPVLGEQRINLSFRQAA